jgi:putative endonuclease
MYSVYAIQSEKDGRVYVGMTSDLEKRLAAHNAGYVFSTKGYIPWKLIYKELCNTRMLARKKEKKLKSGYGKEFLKQNIFRGSSVVERSAVSKAALMGNCKM